MARYNMDTGPDPADPFGGGGESPRNPFLASPSSPGGGYTPPDAPPTFPSPSPGGGYTPPDPPPTFPPPSAGGGYTPPNYTPPTFPTDPGTGLPRVTYPTPTINPGITTQPPPVYRTMTEPRPAQGESGPGLGPGAPAQTQTMPAGYSQAFHDALVAAYQQYLGRTPSEDELVPHYSNPGGFNGALQTIMNSPEAYAYAHRPPTTTGTNTSSTTSAFDPKSWVDQQLSTAQSTDDPSYWYNKIANDANVQNASTRDSALAYWADRIARGDGALAVRNGTTAKYSEGPSGGGYGGTNVFNDPATQQYEQLLNSLIGRLNTPYTPPGFDQMINSLNGYIQQLQGPAYTPQQMDLMQTQALDPLERQRQIAKQQVMQRLGSQGISQRSGIMQQALMQVDNQFNQMRTQTQAGFANNAIGVQKQQAAQAAGLLPQVMGLEQSNYNNQTNNMLQAANLASIIPNMAWQRVSGAGQSVQPINPASLISLMQAISQQNAGQTFNWAQLFAQLGLGTANLFRPNGPSGSGG